MDTVSVLSCKYRIYTWTDISIHTRKCNGDIIYNKESGENSKRSDNLKSGAERSACAQALGPARGAALS